jgi:hypothetical protein
MIIRDFHTSDLESMKRIHAASCLPSNCLPNLSSPLFVVKKVVENGSGPMMGGFLRLTGEIFLLVDRSKGNPESRWAALQELCAQGLNEAANRHIQQVTAWIPEEVEQSFGKRLEALGFERSKWPSFTATLE